MRRPSRRTRIQARGSRGHHRPTPVGALRTMRGREAPSPAARFTGSDTGDTLVTMKTISIKELHEKTGEWLRRVRTEGELVVTERGTPIARMLPPAPAAARSPFAKRRLL